MSSVNNNIPFVPENTIDPAAGLNESINVIDALLQVAVVSVGENTPPGSPTVGARYIVGTSPTGAWSGQANKLARWIDGMWSFFDARYAVSLSDNKQYIRGASGWSAIDSSGEWSAETVSQAEAEAGTADIRRAWTAQRVRQAIVAWWNSASSAWGRGLVASADAAAGRTALGLGSAATRTALGTTGALYSRDSILGTVSQSAGIPTGAIIERGSNANGEYVRFADGTMICTLRRSVSLAIDIAFVGGFRSNYEAWTYPASFAGATTPSLQGSAPVTAHGLMFQGDISSGVNISVLAPTSTAAGTRIISATVIGRWY